jgi:serine/threonine protein kinase
LAFQEKAASLGIGSRFGAYEVVSHHGSGGMADIWVARRTFAAAASDPPPETSAERFAIKTLLARRAHRAEFVERFAQEAELHRVLDHPNVIRMIETDTEADVRYMVLEFVQGLNLRQMIHAAKPKPLPRSVIYDIMASVCDALEYVHNLAGAEGPLGLVHGDVSPENVMIGLDGSVKLIDFGLAIPTLAGAVAGPSLAVVETSVLRPGPHVPQGRLQYLAPERVDGRGMDRRSDIYSVGSMLFELVHGKRPFQAHATFELLTRICQGATVEPDPAVDLETRDLIEHAMAVAPENRIDTAQHLAHVLRLLRDLCDPDEPSAGAVVRRLFGLEEMEEAEEIDLLWTEEKATAEFLCLDSLSDTPLLEEGTALDAAIRELLHETSGETAKAPPPDVSGLLEIGDLLDGAAPSPEASLAETTAAEAPSSEPASRPPTPLPDLFAPVSRARPTTVDLFAAYDKRARAPDSGIFLSNRESTPDAPPENETFVRRREEGGVKIVRAAAAHFETGWNLLRAGKANETLAEWEAAMQLDPNNRSYAVNVQKLRLKLQG